MSKKITGWKTKGMNRDLSVSAFNQEFAFENMNLRLSTNDGNTMLSWVNEKGTQRIVSTDEVTDDTPCCYNVVNPEEGKDVQYKKLYGNIIGTAVLNHQLVFFTTRENNGGREDRIYKCWFSDSGKMDLEVMLLYKGNLGFDEEYPIETLTSFESDTIQKVYWTDGKNQPRMINIAFDMEVYKNWIANSAAYSTHFDFIPSFTGGKINVVNTSSSGGTFAPGVIQYCFTYINKHGQQSNIVDVSPLFYLSHSDRGASPDSKVGSTFKISIDNPDNHFDMARLYSIQRTSLNLEPIVKHLEDIKLEETTIEYTDNGTTGALMDPTELLFVGGKEITALTMTDKDSTLFLGNIRQKNPDVSSLQSKMKPTITFNTNKTVSLIESPTGVYCYKNLLKGHSQKDITTFKGNEWYRFGIQLQKKTGEWTEPIWIGDKQNDLYPSTDVGSSTANLVTASATVNFPDGFDYSEYKYVRPVIVYPNAGDRTVICQGVLNPTVFNVLDRKENAPFAQASWYFRPIMKNSIDVTDPTTGAKKKVIDLSEKVTVVSADELSRATDTSTIDSNIADGMAGSGEYNDLHAYALAGQLGSTYVVVVNIPGRGQPAYGPIISSGFLSIHEETWDEEFMYGKVRVNSNDNKYYFNGAIKVGESNDYTTWAFTRESPWPIPATRTETSKDSNARSHYYSCSYNKVEYVSSTDKPFPIYKFLSRTDDNQYYLQASEENSEEKTFYFRFYTFNTLYTIKFKNVNFEGGYNVDLNNHGGSSLRYEHFDSLYCSSEITEGSSTTDATQARRCIEIQGSLAIYDDAMDAPPKRTAELKSAADNEAVSNTQFFIDQSIVTLNSPDIEFDTDVQNCDMEGLKLRIVGVIPITANASAFYIDTNSSMMPLSSKRSFGNDFLGLLKRSVYEKVTDSSHISFGAGARTSQNIVYNNVNIYAGNRLIADYLWNDALVMHSDEGDTECVSSTQAYDFLIHPWHRSGSLNNDFRGNDTASSMLKTKIESNILFSTQSIYNSNYSMNLASSQMVHTENAEVMNYRLNLDYGSYRGINYYPNIDKILYNTNGYTPWVKELSGNETVENVFTPISMKYKSTSHAVLAFSQVPNGDKPFVYALPDTIHKPQRTTLEGKPFWESGSLRFYSIPVKENSSSYIDYNYLWLGELYREDEDVPNRFGGTSTAALKANKWLIGGDTKPFNSNGVTLTWDIGDTYYQRYDCLKTYPFTEDDPNQLVEILSFMCETRINLDGRYDKNRGLLDNTLVRPRNFNLLNPVYSQQNNFFTSRKSSDEGDIFNYPNHIFYTKSKTSGADVDLWTNVTLGSILEMDGNKGEVRDLERFNDQIICFQDTGISQILYNESVQVTSTQGVPIEIANSGKVQGKRYLSNTIGTSNKWSVCPTPLGLYFIDFNDRSIYRFDGKLTNLSIQGGMNSWSKQMLQYSEPWNPTFPSINDTVSTVVTYYDRQNQDVLFINKNTAMAYSEKLGAFTSFYDYGGAPYLVNFDDKGLWFKSSIVSGQAMTQPHWHQLGEYCEFFGEKKPYWTTLIGNPEPQMDKIFTNLEFRACVDTDGSRKTVTEDGNEVQVFDKFHLPFDSLETWDEYQHGVALLQNKNGHAAQQHHLRDENKTAALKRKFRIWRCDIPRDNAEVDDEIENAMGIYRVKAHPMDRMRNPWLYLKLLKKAADKDSHLQRTEIHDILMSYFS